MILPSKQFSPRKFDLSEQSRGKYPMSDSVSVLPDHPPVTDWVNDFDHTDPRWTENPFPIWEELRAECPVVHTKRFLGCYLPTTYKAVKEIAYDTEHFSSRRVVVRDVRGLSKLGRRRRSPPTRRGTSLPSNCCCRHLRLTL
jgi:hypothetical protein